MAITTMDGLVSALGTGQTLNIWLPSATTVSGGILWINRATANSFGQLAQPTAASSGGQTYSSNSGAGYPSWTAATGGNTSYLGFLSASSNQTSNIILYDTWWACSGFSGTSTTLQSVTGFSGLPTRAGTGAGGEIWMYVNTAIGATTATVTVTYTNSAGVGSRTTTFTTIASQPANRMIQMTLQSGDVGVQSIQSVQLNTSTTTTGNWGLVIMERITNIPFQTLNVGINYDFASIGMPTIDDNTCLSFIGQGTTTNTGNNLVALKVIQG